MQKLFSIIAILLLSVLLFGCGSGPSSDTTGSDSGKAATESDGTQKQVEKDDQGSADEGSVPLAEGFPEDFPLIEGMVTQSEKTDFISLKDGSKTGEGYQVLITSDKSPEEAEAFYKSKFSKTMSEMPYDGGSGMLEGIIGAYKATIYISEQDGKTELNITVGNP